MASGVTVKLVGTDRLLRKLRDLGDGMAEALEAATQTGALVVQNAAKEKAPYRTGTLRRSIHMETTKRTRDEVEVAVGTDLEYAAIHEFGGTITPKTAKKLHFFVDGEEVFADEVQIPARPYLRPALDENKDKVVEEIGAALKAAIGKLVK